MCIQRPNKSSANAKVSSLHSYLQIFHIYHDQVLFLDFVFIFRNFSRFVRFLCHRILPRNSDKTWEMLTIWLILRNVRKAPDHAICSKYLFAMTCALYTFLLNYEFHFWKIISPCYPCLLQPQVLANPNAILSWVQPLMFEESGTPKETLKEILNFRKPWWVHKTNKSCFKKKIGALFQKIDSINMWDCSFIHLEKYIPTTYN